MSDFKSIKPGAMGRERALRIREFVLDSLDTDKYSDIGAAIAREFKAPRHVVYKQLSRLEENGLIEGRGRTNAREYRLRSDEHRETRDVEGLDEYAFWDQFAAPHLADLPEHIVGICSYGFTEMVNNVIDHSDAPMLWAAVKRNHKMVELIVTDRGVGIFRKIQKALELPSPQEAIFELSKGKLTTDPEKHTGEGIFYTSRMFDNFHLLSAGLFLSHERAGNDWLSGADDDKREGTAVFMTIDPRSTHTAQEVFEHYSVPRDDFAFNKTNVILRLLDTGDQSFISRSQAKRVLARLPRFKEVILDFTDIKTIGPAFADEIFRVFSNAHSDVRLIPINMTDEVSRMVDRARRARAESIGTTHSEPTSD